MHSTRRCWHRSEPPNSSRPLDGFNYVIDASKAYSKLWRQDGTAHGKRMADGVAKSVSAVFALV